MNLEQILFTGHEQYEVLSTQSGFNCDKANLVLAFGERTLLEEGGYYPTLKERYPNAEIVICSTSGQIYSNKLIQEQLVATAIQFEKTKVKQTEINLLENNDLSYYKKQITDELISDDLNTLLVFSEGTYVNGTELVEELMTITQNKVAVFGGLAGDSRNFKRTIVGINKEAKEGVVVLVGLYGKNLRSTFGSDGGWTEFGPERKVTLSEKNVLYKLDDHYALDIYKKYLGKFANELPASALLFPISLRVTKNSTPIVRSILSINDEDKSMTFSGNIPENSFVRLMTGHFDKLIDASFYAAKKTIEKTKKAPQLVIVVSCIGRKIVLDNRIEEELDALKEVYGEKTVVCGFYSYGEISPIDNQIESKLHNQTITLATLSEIV